MSKEIGAQSIGLALNSGCRAVRMWGPGNSVGVSLYMLLYAFICFVTGTEMLDRTTDRT